VPLSTSRSSAENTAPDRRTRFVTLFALLLVAAALRVPGLADDFWLDEVWSWTLVWNWDGSPRVTGLTGVFTEIHQDNNNHLVTLWLYVSGPHAPLWWYRMPMFLAGLALIEISGLLAARWSPDRPRSASMWTMWLATVTTIYVAYASECRGYMLAAWAGAASQWWLGRFLDSRDMRSAGLFAVMSSLGFLSHLSYLPAFVAHGVWCASRLVGRSGLPRETWWRAGLAFGVPTLVVGVLWVVDLSRTRVGGGPLLSPWGTAVDVLALLFGMDGDPVLAIPAALVTAVLMGGGLMLARAAPHGEWRSLAVLLGAAPAILFGLAPAGLVYPRHFLVPLALLVPLAGGALAWLFATTRGRAIAFTVILLFGAGHVRQLVPLIRDGRGAWVSALEFIASETRATRTGDAGPPARIGGDHDFRDGMLVEFHRARARGRSGIEYVPQSGWAARPPEWLIVHSLERGAEFPPDLTTSDAAWTLRRTVPLGGPTGFAWGVYERMRTTNAPAQ
jgi:hypothetical protein